MFQFPCNKCFDKYGNGPQLYLSRCGHIFCKKCLESNCEICSRPIKSIPISAKMPREVAEYFIDPMKHHQKFMQVAKFQREQQRIYAQHYIRVHKDKRKKQEEQMRGFDKLERSLKDELEEEREKIRKYREQLACYERRMENGYHEQQSLQPRLLFNNSVSNSSRGTKSRPRSTTLSSSSMGVKDGFVESGKKNPKYYMK
uniref:RING-type domain-containing protein n=1 Tax=Glossina brevipalpis TaxID=37001 RepID=A0A1A9W6M5_9MUSC